MLCLNFCRQLRLGSEQEEGARCGAGAGIVLARAANDPLVITITARRTLLGAPLLGAY